jgi:hypothetical protein
MSGSVLCTPNESESVLTMYGFLMTIAGMGRAAFICNKKYLHHRGEVGEFRANSLGNFNCYVCVFEKTHIMLSRFVVLLLLYLVVMFVGTLHLEQDDTRLTGVHIRTLISALQVWIAGVLLSLYCLFMFFIRIVKSERNSFVMIRHPNYQAPSSDNAFNRVDIDAQESAVGFAPEQEETNKPREPQSDALSITSVGSDPIPLDIVFASSVNLDMYVLYVNFVGLMLWGTFISFNFALYDSTFVLLCGIVAGWILNTISQQCRCHESTTVKGQKVRILCCIGLSVVVMCMGALDWQQPQDIDFGDAVNLYGPAFWCGFFWTAVAHEVAFAGVQNLHVSKGIFYDTRRSLPTFLLVVSVAALCSSPETRTTVTEYVGGLSRLAAVHMLFIEPVLIFMSVYVLVLSVEKKRGEDLTVVLVLVEGAYIAYRRETYDGVVISTIVASVLLLSMHAAHLLRAGVT